MLKRNFIIILAICLSAIAHADTFSHYVGHANTSFDSRGMQRVAEVHYYYFVHSNGQSFNITLPLMNYSSSGNDTEPRNYFRWYDYNTDRSSANLVKQGIYLEEVSDKGGISRGLIAYNLPSKSSNNSAIRPSQSTVGVTYVPPAGATEESWKGETIACDVSRYNDFGGKGGVMNAEPTLSIRFIFHIRPARLLARNIINAVSTDLKTEHADVTYEDNRRIVFGAKDANSSMTLRTEYAPDHYFFYPLVNASTKHAYPTTDEHNIKSSDFNTSTMYQANCIQWRVYDPTKTKYTILTSAGTQMMWFTSINTIINNGNGWKDLNGNSTSKPVITYGDEVFFVAYACVRNTSNMAPIANFGVLYQTTYPKTRDEIIADGDNERMVDYLDEHYQLATKPISFDDDNDELDLTAPTTPDNNMSRLPSKWDRRTYGFVYRELKNFTPSSTTAKKWWLPYTPVHGEYGLYKSANLKGVSDVANGYVWWNTSKVLYDRTYEYTGGKQYGHFLYIDASDESRQIAAADFKANLCSGARLIFSGAIADFTTTSGTQPEVMFKLYGVIRDDNDSITSQRLIISFSSGDFSNNIQSRQIGNWFQVYSRIVLPKNTGAENYSDFRIVMDNMCKSTNGADYCIDDLRLYITPAKVDVVQNRPLCPNDGGSADLPKYVTVKLRAHYDNMLAMVGDKQSVVYYRLCDADGNAVTTIDYDGDGKPDAYGTAEIPAVFDATKMLPAYAADGSTTTPMFETDAENHVIILFANRNFNLPVGKDFYVSVAFPDDDNDGKPGAWGVPTNVCSTYSEMFQIVQQSIVITDANGNVVTTVRVSCDADRTPDVNISGKLETVDIVNGGKVTLNNVKFDWFLSKPNESNKFLEIEQLEESLNDFRMHFPNATSLDASYATLNPTRYALLKKYVDDKQLVIAASNNLNSYRFGKDMIGTYVIAAIPIATSITEGRTTYEICPDPMFFSLRILEDGPKLTLGFRDVVYPNDDRAVRIGLPQIRALVAKDQTLLLPVTSLESSKSISFNNDADIFISDTNDPSFSSDRQIVGTIATPLADASTEQLAVRFNSSALTTLHEGYWYEFNFSYSQNRIGSETVVSCPGETFITFKIVPEYLTWNSSPSNKLNANWNNDLNWMRSTAAELYKTDYTDYGPAATFHGNATDKSVTRQMAYVPMKFSKVTIADQTGRVYPDLGNTAYRASNQIATKLTNTKGEAATANIVYDIVAKWNYSTADGSDTGDGAFSCEKFQGNLCDEIYFKPSTELLDPCFLVYRRAYAEKELMPRKWYLVASPLKDTYAGDFYVPTSGRQETEAFKPIRFSTPDYSRTLYPFYQRSWDSHAQEIVDADNFYEAYDYNDGTLRIDTISDASINVESLYWSHVFNKMDMAYGEGRAMAVRVGDNYYPAAAATAPSLVRLPKADTHYDYYNGDGTLSATSVDIAKSNIYRLLVDYSNTSESLSQIAQQLQTNVHGSDSYYLVGNPYTSSLSAIRFLQGNTAFAPKIWLMEDGKLRAYTLPEDGTYDRQSDVLISPMEAFFVKVADGAVAPDQASFTSKMMVDRWLVGGTNVKATSASLDITASPLSADGSPAGRQSMAKVTLSSDASAEFSDTEDAELLDNTDLDDIPQVYTMAGEEATALNRTDRIEWLPIGVVAKSGGQVELTFSRSRSLTVPLWLFDARTREFTPVADSTVVRVDAGDHGRYYLTTASSAIVSGDIPTAIRCFSPSAGKLAVSSPGSELNSIRVYTTGGQLIAERSDIASPYCTMYTGSGIFIVSVSTADGETKETKIAVR